MISPIPAQGMHLVLGKGPRWTDVALMNDSAKDVTISAEAVDLLSRLGDGFDEVILAVGESAAASRPEGDREVSADDIRKALSDLCAIIVDFLKVGHAANDQQTAMLGNLLAYFKSLGAC